MTEHQAAYYEIVDHRTGAVVGRCRTLRAASRSVDRRDSAWGAYRYGWRRVETIETVS